ncbi:MAG: hypothetical protein LAN71_12315 [Acidobacteriia bacterium]|nr:hypothetical protein [Terriglobia bacterium]
MNDSPKDVYNLRSFEYLIYDAVHLLYLADDEGVEQGEGGYGPTYTRTSILNTLLLFECAANCCIDALNLPGGFEEDIDRLPFLSKYEFFLSCINPAAKFDRGCKEVQVVAELKAVRDSYVHPKVKKRKYSKADDFWSPDFGHTTILKIPRNPTRWETSHAMLALKSANDFFNLFFLSWCKFDTNRVCEILLSSDPAGIPATASIGIYCIEGLTRAVRDYGIDFLFIGKVVRRS